MCLCIGQGIGIERCCSGRWNGWAKVCSKQSCNVFRSEMKSDLQISSSLKRMILSIVHFGLDSVVAKVARWHHVGMELLRAAIANESKFGGIIIPPSSCLPVLPVHDAGLSLSDIPLD